MGKSEKLLLKILRGASDSNIAFEQLCQLLINMGFERQGKRKKKVAKVWLLARS